MKQKPVFFYGLFMDPELLVAQGYYPIEHQIAQLNHYRLHLGERATLIPDQNSSVWGSIMTLSQNELDKLYTAPTVKDYQPVSIICTSLTAENIPSLTYTLPPDYTLIKPKSTSYALQLIDICIKLSLPKYYSEHVYNIISKIEDDNSIC
ncbi:MAG: gamma-glutamylcyclotransferase [Proteobacteria bacterium]|jgi:hypothetical protein|nr:gamma-glutamylcyclotransferase [Pseudomonadota bacterium]